MPETPPIPPALSESDSRELAEDTAIRACRDIYGTLVEDMNGELWAFTPSPEGFHRAMAVANFALPDGDPRKVTRAMVQAVEQSLWAQYGGGFTVDWLAHCATCQRELPAGSMTFCREHHADMLRALSAALAALLPPAPRP